MRARGERPSGHRARIASTLAALAWIAVASTAPPAGADDPLDPYRRIARSDGADLLVAEARAAMRAHFGLAIDPPATAPPDWPGPPAGLYVSLVRDHKTRACVGSAMPWAGTLREAVRAMSVQVLQADRRHPPVRAHELDNLWIVLSFTSPLEPVADAWSIDPDHEGLLVSSARGSIAFLPGEVRTVAYALREARRLGVLAHPREATFHRFKVVAIRKPVRTTAHGNEKDRGATSHPEKP